MRWRTANASFLFSTSPVCIYQGHLLFQIPANLRFPKIIYKNCSTSWEYSSIFIPSDVALSACVDLPHVRQCDWSYINDLCTYSKGRNYFLNLSVYLRKEKISFYHNWVNMQSKLHKWIRISTAGFAFLTPANVQVAVFRAVAVRSVYYPEDGGIKGLWNVGKLLPDFKALQPRTQLYSVLKSIFMIENCIIHFSVFVHFRIEARTWKALESREGSNSCPCQNNSFSAMYYIFLDPFQIKNFYKSLYLKKILGQCSFSPVLNLKIFSTDFKSFITTSCI
jgi:hypothetical protein